MLEKMLQKEIIDRVTEANRKAAETAEASEIVAGIHAAFNQELDCLKKLYLIGDYERPISILERNPNGMTKNNGLSIVLGQEISQRVLQLFVVPRIGDQPPVAKLSIGRAYPLNTELLREFDGHAPAEEMLETLLSVLVKNVAQQ